MQGTYPAPLASLANLNVTRLSGLIFVPICNVDSDICWIWENRHIYILLQGVSPTKTQNEITYLFLVTSLENISYFHSQTLLPSIYPAT